MMSVDDDEAKKALATLGAGPAAAELYKDLLQPAARELGGNLHAAAKLITTALLPLHAVVLGVDKIRDWLTPALAARLAHVPLEDVQSPKGYVAGQALLQLTFCADEEHLRELYANLLAAAMDRSRSAAVHPAFVQVIQQLSPDEAVILGRLPDPLELIDTDGAESLSLALQFEAVCARAGVSDLERTNGYLDNLLRLRILSERTSAEDVRVAAGGRPDPGKPRYRRGVSTHRAIVLTAFGESFLDVCVRPRSTRAG